MIKRLSEQVKTLSATSAATPEAPTPEATSAAVPSSDFEVLIKGDPDVVRLMVDTINTHGTMEKGSLKMDETLAGGGGRSNDDLLNRVSGRLVDNISILREDLVRYFQAWLQDAYKQANSKIPSSDEKKKGQLVQLLYGGENLNACAKDDKACTARAIAGIDKFSRVREHRDVSATCRWAQARGDVPDGCRYKPVEVVGATKAVVKDGKEELPTVEHGGLMAIAPGEEPYLKGTISVPKYQLLKPLEEGTKVFMDMYGFVNVLNEDNTVRERDMVVGATPSTCGGVLSGQRGVFPTADPNTVSLTAPDPVMKQLASEIQKVTAITAADLNVAKAALVLNNTESQDPNKLRQLVGYTHIAPPNPGAAEPPDEKFQYTTERVNSLFDKHYVQGGAAVPTSSQTFKLGKKGPDRIELIFALEAEPPRSFKTQFIKELTQVEDGHSSQSMHMVIHDFSIPDTDNPVIIANVDVQVTFDKPVNDSQQLSGLFVGEDAHNSNITYDREVMNLKQITHTDSLRQQIAKSMGLESKGDAVAVKAIEEPLKIIPSTGNTKVLQNQKVPLKVHRFHTISNGDFGAGGNKQAEKTVYSMAGKSAGYKDVILPEIELEGTSYVLVPVVNGTPDDEKSWTTYFKKLGQDAALTVASKLTGKDQGSSQTLYFDDAGQMQWVWMSTGTVKKTEQTAQDSSSDVEMIPIQHNLHTTLMANDSGKADKKVRRLLTDNGLPFLQKAVDPRVASYTGGMPTYNDLAAFINDDVLRQCQKQSHEHPSLGQLTTFTLTDGTRFSPIVQAFLMKKEKQEMTQDLIFSYTMAYIDQWIDSLDNYPTEQAVLRKDFMEMITTSVLDSSSALTPHFITGSLLMGQHISISDDDLKAKKIEESDSKVNYFLTTSDKLDNGEDAVSKGTYIILALRKTKTGKLSADEKVVLISSVDGELKPDFKTCYSVNVQKTTEGEANMKKMRLIVPTMGALTKQGTGTDMILWQYYVQKGDQQIDTTGLYEEYAEEPTEEQPLLAALAQGIRMNPNDKVVSLPSFELASKSTRKDLTVPILKSDTTDDAIIVQIENPAGVYEAKVPTKPTKRGQVKGNRLKLLKQKPLPAGGPTGAAEAGGAEAGAAEAGGAGKASESGT